MGDFDFGLRTVQDRFAESDGKAYGGTENLVIVGIIVDVAAKVIRVEAKLAKKTFAGAELKIVSVRGFDGQAKDAGVERRDLLRAGKKNVLE